MRQIFRFGVVGTIGFVVDAAVLYAALWVNFGYIYGRLTSFFCAALVTWLINRRITFSFSKSKSLKKEFAAYLIAMSGGAIINFVFYKIVITSFSYRPVLPLLGVAAGSLAGMGCNFVVAKIWVFRDN
jgi:putative flippase GtrA